MRKMKIKYSQALVLLLNLALLLPGCSLLNNSTNSEVLELSLTPQKSQIRQGEALLLRATLINISGKPLVVRELNADSMEFWFWTGPRSERLKKKPIYSLNENLNLMKQLEPGESMERPFLFTKTAGAGTTISLQSIYETPFKKKSWANTAVSPAQKVFVRGPALFKRGHDGLILEEEASRIIRAITKLEIQKEKAVLIRNEAGFLEWVVKLELKDGSRKAFLVNPYLGGIRAEVNPDIKIKELQQVREKRAPAGKASKP